MFTNEIVAYMRKQPGFLGVFALDQLPLKIHQQASLIDNSDPHWLPGKHWFAFSLYPESGKMIYFDSFARPPNKQMIFSLMRQWRLEWIELSPYPIQLLNRDFTDTTGECGEFCIYILHHLSRYADNIDLLIRQEFSETDYFFNKHKVRKYIKDFKI